MANSASLRDARDALSDAETELERAVHEEPEEDAISALYHTHQALISVRALLRRT